MRLIGKKTPCGEKESSRKTVYESADPFFCFWYRFLFPNRSYYELLDASDILTQPAERHYMLFSKSGFTSAVKKEAARREIELITPEMLLFDHSPYPVIMR